MKTIPHVLDALSTDRLNLHDAVVGRGPDWKRSHPEIFNAHRSIALNHSHGQCQFSHFIDLEPILQGLYRNDVIIMPQHPHLNGKPIDHVDLDHLSIVIPQLRNARDNGRLWSYDLMTSAYRGYPSHPVIEAWTSSAQAVFDILGHLGSQEIRTLGISGPNTGLGQDGRHGSFKHDMSAGPKSYDVQIEGLEKIIRKHDLRWIRV